MANEKETRANAIYANHKRNKSFTDFIREYIHKQNVGNFDLNNKLKKIHADLLIYLVSYYYYLEDDVHLKILKYLLSQQLEVQRPFVNNLNKGLRVNIKFETLRYLLEREFLRQIKNRNTYKEPLDNNKLDIYVRKCIELYFNDLIFLQGKFNDKIYNDTTIQNIFTELSNHHTNETCRCARIWFNLKEKSSIKELSYLAKLLQLYDIEIHSSYVYQILSDKIENTIRKNVTFIARSNKGNISEEHLTETFISKDLNYDYLWIWHPSKGRGFLTWVKEDLAHNLYQKIKFTSEEEILMNIKIAENTDISHPAFLLTLAYFNMPNFKPHIKLCSFCYKFQYKDDGIGSYQSFFDDWKSSILNGIWNYLLEYFNHYKILEHEHHFNAFEGQLNQSIAQLYREDIYEAIRNEFPNLIVRNSQLQIYFQDIIHGDVISYKKIRNRISNWSYRMKSVMKDLLNTYEIAHIA